MSPELITARVAAVRALALDVLAVDLEAADGRSLPLAEAGAHIDVHLPGGVIRNYSIFEPQAAPRAYRIAIGRSATSRGGSAFVHDHLRVGDTVGISPPRNNFPLNRSASRVVMVAGGIGITPLMAMARQCDADGRDWTLHYCARVRSRAPFLDELRTLQGGNSRVHLWLSKEDGKRFDAQAVLSAAAVGTAHVYCCGPDQLMQAVEKATSHLAPDQVHFERFSAPVSDPPESSTGTFELYLKRSDAVLQVLPGQSTLECIEAHGVSVPFSCREGLCGTCETAVIDGVIDHRDFVLSAADRASHQKMMVCVSRAACARVTLDL